MRLLSLSAVLAVTMGFGSDKPVGDLDDIELAYGLPEQPVQMHCQKRLMSNGPTGYSTCDCSTSNYGRGQKKIVIRVKGFSCPTFIMYDPNTGSWEHRY